MWLDAWAAWLSWIWPLPGLPGSVACNSPYSVLQEAALAPGLMGVDALSCSSHIPTCAVRFAGRRKRHSPGWLHVSARPMTALPLPERRSVVATGSFQIRGHGVFLLLVVTRLRTMYRLRQESPGNLLPATPQLEPQSTNGRRLPACQLINLVPDDAAGPQMKDRRGTRQCDRHRSGPMAFWLSSGSRKWRVCTQDQGASSDLVKTITGGGHSDSRTWLFPLSTIPSVAST
ncbi:hypothetical protein BJ546DRAFT_374160 [Cryomyces antarcticus]